MTDREDEPRPIVPEASAPGPFLPPPPGAPSERGFRPIPATSAPPRPRRRSRPMAVPGFAPLPEAAALGTFLGAQRAASHWRPLYTGAVATAARWKSETREWQQSSRTYQGMLDDVQSQMRDLQAKISSTVGDLNNPRFTLWNSCGAA